MPYLRSRLSRQAGKCAGNYRGINEIGPKLVFRGAYQECAQNPHEISLLRPELVFREPPRQLVQRGGYSQHLRRLGLCRPLIDPVGDGVARVLPPPLRLGFLPVQHPALRFAAHPLPRSYARIGTEPLSADTAGFLSQIRHG
jgi:hypothetical protein